MVAGVKRLAAGLALRRRVASAIRAPVARRPADRRAAQPGPGLGRLRLSRPPSAARSSSSTTPPCRRWAATTAARCCSWGSAPASAPPLIVDGVLEPLELGSPPLQERRPTKTMSASRGWSASARRSGASTCGCRRAPGRRPRARRGGDRRRQRAGAEGTAAAAAAPATTPTPSSAASGCGMETRPPSRAASPRARKRSR